jgi:hypothetical protein
MLSPGNIKALHLRPTSKIHDSYKYSLAPVPAPTTTQENNEGSSPSESKRSFNHTMANTPDYKECITCGSVFFKRKNESLKYFKTKKCCSLSCSKKGARPWNFGLKLNYEVWNKGKKGLQVSWLKGKKGYTNTGSFIKNHEKWKHPNAIKNQFPKGYHGGNSFEKGNKPWNKGFGNATENQRIRWTPEYKYWSRSILERDDFTCQECKKRGGELHAHHIKAFAYYPEVRFKLSNGQTLCVKCHYKTYAKVR